MIARWWRSLDRTGRGLVAAGHLAAGLLTWWLAAGWHGYWQQYVMTNVLPPSAWSIAAIIWAKVGLHRKLEANHEDMKQHVSQEVRNG